MTAEASTDKVRESPVAALDTGDPGDAISRCFRYQHAYGVILLAAAALDAFDYVAVWCEQHEDFLAEVSAELFDAYQVKTGTPEYGFWQLNDKVLQKAIRRFVEEDLAFPGKIRRFKFVSNVQHLDSDAEEKRHLSLLRLVKATQSVADPAELIDANAKAFALLKEATGCEGAALFAVLKRMDVVTGPERGSFETDVAHQHISRLPQCAGMDARSLAHVADTMIGRVFKASALASNSPAKHYAALNQNEADQPELKAKRISVADFLSSVALMAGPNFRFVPTPSPLRLGSHSSGLTIMRAKMDRGGLTDYVQAMQWRAISAERHLLDVGTRPQSPQGMTEQLEAIVQTQCDDAKLRTRSSERPYGEAMLIAAQDRLTEMSRCEPKRVFSQSADLLIGIAGLLTEECKVWWSEPFDVEGTK